MSRPVVSVRFETEDEFISAVESEVAHGGLLVSGAAPGVSAGAGCLVSVSVGAHRSVEVPARVAAVARFGVSVVFDERPLPLEQLALRLRAGGAQATPLATPRLRVQTPAHVPVVTPAAMVTPAPVSSTAVTVPDLPRPGFPGAPRPRQEISSPPAPAPVPAPVPRPALHVSASSTAPTRPEMPRPVAQAPSTHAVELRPVQAAAPAGTVQERMAALTPGQKMSAALSGDREIRIALLRDLNKTIHAYVLRNPRIGLDEVQWAAKMTTISAEALKVIFEHKEWGANPTVVAALVRNPVMPTSIAIRLLPKLSNGELRAIAKGGARDQVVQAARKMLAT